MDARRFRAVGHGQRQGQGLSTARNITGGAAIHQQRRHAPTQHHSPINTRRLTLRSAGGDGRVDAVGSTRAAKCWLRCHHRRRVQLRLQRRGDRLVTRNDAADLVFVDEPAALRLGRVSLPDARRRLGHSPIDRARRPRPPPTRLQPRRHHRLDGPLWPHRHRGLPSKGRSRGD